MVKFWDARTCTQLFSFPAHGADVLCLAISPVSIDFCKTRAYSCLIPYLGWQLGVHIWSRPKGLPFRAGQECGLQYFHSLDILHFQTHALTRCPRTRDLAPLPPHLHQLTYRSGHRMALYLPVFLLSLYQEGLDGSPVLTPCASAISTTTSTKMTNALATSVMSTFEDAYHRRMPYTTGAMAPAIHLSRAQKLLFCVKREFSGSLEGPRAGEVCCRIMSWPLSVMKSDFRPIHKGTRSCSTWIST